MMKREELINYVKQCGQEIIDKAEDLVDNVEFLSEFNIFIYFSENDLPELRTSATYKSAKFIKIAPER